MPYQQLITGIMGQTVPSYDTTSYGVVSKVKEGTRKLENIVLRRIFITYPILQMERRIIDPGHYWIEIIHQDEDKVDKFMEKARTEELTEKDLPTLNGICNKANGFRESYGWYPDDASYWGTFKILKGNGFLNGDCELRRKMRIKYYLI